MSRITFAQKLVPKGYQIVSEYAIDWLFRVHPAVYAGFYERADMEHHSREKELAEAKELLEEAKP